MTSVEDLVPELKKLTPEQLKQVARMVHSFATEPSVTEWEQQGPELIPPEVVAQAVANGWSEKLFTQVLGRVGKDFQRHSQPPYKTRKQW